jgi:septin family protein
MLSGLLCLILAFSWYAMQDTPGYGDDTDVEKSIRMIVDYVVRQNEEYFAMEFDYSDTRDIASREDPRVSSLVLQVQFSLYE